MPAGSPLHSAMITRNFGLAPNPSRRRSFSVQETAFGARSYSANSRMNDNISGISSGTALRSFNIANDPLASELCKIDQSRKNFSVLLLVKFQLSRLFY